MTGWIIASAVILFFAVLLGTAVKVKAEYREGAAEVKFGFWFFWFRLYPGKEKKKKKKASKKKTTSAEKSAPKQKKEKKKEKADFELIKNLISTAVRGLRIFFRHLTVKIIRIRIIVGDEDAADCAIRYGRICGAVHGVMAAGKNLIRLRDKEISLSCDFDRKESCYDLAAEAKIRVIFLLEAAAVMAFQFFIKIIRNKSSES